jgi:MFS family permease
VSVWATYRQLLGNRQLTKLLLGEFVSSIGDWLYLVALVVVVYDETGDPVILGIVGAARLVPYFVLSIPAGVISDRFDRRLILLVSDLARAVCMLLLAYLVATDAGILPLAIVTVIATCFSTFFYPGFGALMPSLVRDESEFGPANSAWATLDNLAWVIGPAIAGVILVVGTLEMAFLLNALTFAVIGIVLWSLPKAPPGSAPIPLAGSGVRANDLDGTEALSRDPDQVRRVFGLRVPRSIDLSAVTGVIVLDAFSWLAFGGINILLVLLAIDVFKAGDAATGLLNVAIGVGGTFGAILSGVLVLRPRLAPALLAAGAAMGGATVLLGIAPLLSVAFLAVAVASVGHLVLDVTRTTIFQRVVPDAYRGRFTGVLMTSSTASEALGTLIVPILIGGYGISLVLGAVGIGLFAATVLSIVLIGRAADLAPGRYDAELRRIARLPIFGGLKVAGIESALRRLEPVRVEAGDVVVRQGEPADRFFIVGEGTFEVTIAAADGASRHVRTLGPDAVFGERGLLGGTPRTATVTAREPGLLFAMDGPDFLALVTKRRGVAERLMSLYEQPGPAQDDHPADDAGQASPVAGAP